MKMNIAVLTSSYPRYPGDGVAPFVQSISKALHDRGHHIEVLAPYDPKVIQQHNSEITVHRFRYTWPSKNHIMGHAQSLQADVKLRPLVFVLLPFFIMASFFNLLKLCKRIEAQVIHAHWVIPNGLAAALVSKITKLPLVISLHGSDIFVADKNFIFRAIAKWIFSQAQYVTACSQELKTRALKMNPKINVELIPWGADPEVFKPLPNRIDFRRAYGIQEDQILIAALGRLVYKKGFENLIKIVSKLTQTNQQVKFIIGGSGPLENKLKEKADKLNVSKYIIFPGFIPWNKVPDFLSAADIFVLPSQRDKKGNLDGLPTVLLEAMSCALPVVASNVGGVSLVVEDYKTGFLVNPGDTEELLSKIQYLVIDKKKRHQMGLEARENVISHFNWGEVAKRFENIFINSIASKKKKRLGEQYRVNYLTKLKLKLSGDSVLDIGCHDSSWLTKIEANTRIGLDLNPDMIFNNLSLIKADACHLPFRDAAFDVIYMLDVIEHIPDDKNLVKETLRVLKTGGKLILTTPNANIKIFPNFLTGWVSKKWGHDERRGYTEEEILALFSSKAKIKIKPWAARWYRGLYLLLRSLYALLPKLALSVLDNLVKKEIGSPYGEHGFLVAEITKK